MIMQTNVQTKEEVSQSHPGRSVMRCCISCLLCMLSLCGGNLLGLTRLAHLLAESALSSLSSELSIGGRRCFGGRLGLGAFLLHGGKLNLWREVESMAGTDSCMLNSEVLL